ncbi:hypothetical protein [Trueperella sp. LYQ141]|uniref:hypothetical protein n=1 Tax=Trueperella sp. LYQ141 TaxID=3391058 RepID=UPI003983CBF0
MLAQKKLAIIIASILTLTAVGGLAVTWFKTDSTEPQNTSSDSTNTYGALSIEVAPHQNWTEQSSPLIVRIDKDTSDPKLNGTDAKDKDANKDVKSADKADTKATTEVKTPATFYHAIKPSTKATTDSIIVDAGNYKVSYITPITNKGELFTVPQPVNVAVKPAEGSKMAATAEKVKMEVIPADQVKDEDLKKVLDQVKDAVAKGDETLKGEAGKDAVNKTTAGVAANPKASEETKNKVGEVIATAPVDEAPVFSTPKAPAQPAQPAKPAPQPPAVVPAQPAPAPQPVAPAPAPQPVIPDPQPEPDTDYGISVDQPGVNINPNPPAPQPVQPAQPVCQPQYIGEFVKFLHDGHEIPSNDFAAIEEYGKYLLQHGYTTTHHTTIQKYTECP